MHGSAVSYSIYEGIRVSRVNCGVQPFRLTYGMLTHSYSILGIWRHDVDCCFSVLRSPPPQKATTTTTFWGTNCKTVKVMRNGSVVNPYLHLAMNCSGKPDQRMSARRSAWIEVIFSEITTGFKMCLWGFQKCGTCLGCMCLLNWKWPSCPEFQQLMVDRCFGKNTSVLCDVRQSVREDKG